MALTPLLHRDQVHERRYVAGWSALTFAAGAINAGALDACARFVTHVTGTLTWLGVDIRSARLVLDYVVIVACFIGGGVASVYLLDGRRLAGRRALPRTALGIVAGLLVVCAIAGYFDAFGPFGTTVETPQDFLLLSILSFASGLQNASIATVTGMIVRTSHMTGATTDFALGIGTFFQSRAEMEARRAGLVSARLRGSQLLSFSAGAAVAGLAAGSLQYLVFFIPAAVLVVTSLVMFHPSRLAPQKDEPRPSRSFARR